MIKITRTLIKEIIKMENPTDKDYNVLWKFIHKNLLSSIIVKTDELTTLALAKYNQHEVKTKEARQ